MSLKDLKTEYIEAKLSGAIFEVYPMYNRGFVKIGENKWLMPYIYVESGDKLYNFKTRPDDTWIITYPRSGTTVTQELTWLVANDLNFNEAHQTSLLERFPYIEYSLYVASMSTRELNSHLQIIGLLLEDHTIQNSPAAQKIEKYSIEYVQDLPSPRFIKSHMPFDLLPTVVNSNCKIIYVARNPKDVVVSSYHFHKHHKNFNYKGTFEQFCDTFINNQHMWTPYWEHVKAAWAMRNRANMLFLFYEDLKKDLFGTIKKVAVLFNKTYSDEQIAKLVEHLNIENFRKNTMVNQPAPGSLMSPEQFIRQGKTGNWKEMFTPEIEEEFNKWIADNLKNTDLKFPC